MIIGIAIACAMGIFAHAANARQATKPAEAEADSTGTGGGASGDAGEAADAWPRTFVQAGGDAAEAGAGPNGARVIVYQPQIDSWDKYRDISFRCALAVHRGHNAEPVFGVAEVKAKTAVDADRRLVSIEKPDFVYRFPNVDAESAAECEQLASQVLPEGETMLVSLDRVLAYVDAPASRQREVATSLEPPPIFYSKRPGILLQFTGSPQFDKVPGTSLMFSVNCNWDVIVDPTTATNYLLYGESWLKTRDLNNGPWEVARMLPMDFTRLPNDARWSDVRANVPGKPLDKMPVVFTSREPSEIIVTDGDPVYESIPGVRIRAVQNTEAPLFRHTGDLNFYYLAAGRWFRAKSLDGPWTAATTDLPVDFKQIPRNSDWSYVLASVPGTDEAADAVMLASVPRRATVNVKEVSLSVRYDGAPNFTAIPGTTIEGATNTTSKVFRCDKRYYCCEEAVWFESADSQGPWIVCRSVPDAIYGIPPNDPAHNVTYVNVLGADGDSVETGYTSGYNDVLVTASVLVLGAGVVAAVIAADDVRWNVRINAGGNTISSYGSGAYYDAGRGSFCRSGAEYGPYAGTGGAARWDAATDSWARRGAVNDRGSSITVHSGGYNGLANTFGAQIGRADRYGAWNRGVVSRADSQSPRGGAGWVQANDGGVNSRRAGDGDLYVGRNGNVYRREADGAWQERDGKGWRNAGGDGQRSLDADALARGRGIAASNRAGTSRGGMGGGRRGGGGGGRRGR